MSDLPRTRDGAVVPEEWFDNEPLLIDQDDLKKSYSPKFEEEMADLVSRLEEEAAAPVERADADDDQGVLDFEARFLGSGDPDVDDEDPDDELLDETPADVIEILGFDPLEDC